MPGPQTWPRPGPHGCVAFDEVVVIDTETTGLAPFGTKDGVPINDPCGPDRLCSAAFVLLRRAHGGWTDCGRMAFHVDPCRPVPDAAADVNGFAWSGDGRGVPPGRRDLAGLPRFQDEAPAMARMIGGRPVVFHNSAFDLAVLDAELLRAGLAPLSVPVFCTKKAFSDFLGLGRPHHYVKGTNLNLLCDTLGVDRSSRSLEDGTELHGAPVDADLAARCFQRLEPMGWMLAEAPDAFPHRTAPEWRIAAMARPGAPDGAPA